MASPFDGIDAPTVQILGLAHPKGRAWDGMGGDGRGGKGKGRNGREIDTVKRRRRLLGVNKNYINIIIPIYA